MVVPVAALSHTSLRLDGMSRTAYNHVLPYTRPVGASDEDAARAMYLRCLRSSCYRREERDKRVAAGIETLQDLAAKYDKGQQRFVPPARRKHLRNVELLVAMIWMARAGRTLCHLCGGLQWTFQNLASVIASLPLCLFLLCSAREHSSRYSPES